jgi:hypothetical protein
MLFAHTLHPLASFRISASTNVSSTLLGQNSQEPRYLPAVLDLGDITHVAIR